MFTFCTHRSWSGFAWNLHRAEPKPFWWQTGQRCSSWQLRLLRGQVGDPLVWFGAETYFSSDFWVSAIQGSRTVHLLAFGHLGKRRLWAQRACTNPKWLLKSCIDVETWHLHGGAGTVAADGVVAAGAELMADGAEEAAGAGAERSYGWEGLGTGGTRTCTSFPSVGLGDTGWGRVSSQM